MAWWEMLVGPSPVGWQPERGLPQQGRCSEPAGSSGPFSNSNPESRGDERGQQLRVSTALAENQSPAAPGLDSPQLPVTPAPGDPRPSLASKGTLMLTTYPLFSPTHH